MGTGGLQYRFVRLDPITMSTTSPAVVTASAYLTLHYRLATADGTDLVTTFQGNPATLMLGQGQLAPCLEACLIGLPEGAHTTFALSAEQGFGERIDALVKPVSRATLDKTPKPGGNCNAKASPYQIGDTVNFTAPGGGTFAGVLRELGEESTLVDFNHPLAGKSLQFEVKLIAVM